MNSYDIETFIDNENNFIPFCICFIVKDNTYSFYYEEDEDITLTSINKIFDLLKKKENIQIYVHKLDFDGIFLINSLSKHTNLKYKFDTFIRENSIYAIKIHFDNKTIEFKCSKKILPLPLKEISISFNLLPKLPFPYKFVSKNNLNYIGNVPDKKYFSDAESWKICSIANSKIFYLKKYSISYCLRDVIITKDFMHIIWQILKKFNTNLTNCYSTPSLSLKIFQKNFNSYGIKLTQNKLLDTLLRPSYFGGRCEVYGNPTQNDEIFHFDFSGMYAQCMEENFPCGGYKIIQNNFDLSVPGFYCIDFSSKNLDIPVLPHHRLKNNKLMFSNGKMSNIYWFEEINLFLKLGGELEKIRYGIVFEKYEPVFKEFVRHFSEIRKKNAAHKVFAKLVVNSLYGRLGMDEQTNYSFFVTRNESEKFFSNCNLIAYKSVNNLDFIKAEINDFLLKELNIRKKKTKSNVAMASCITAKARIKLLKAQLSVIQKGGRILYSDTDSIFAAYKYNPLGESHGEVYWDPSNETSHLKDAVFIGPKTYGLRFQNNKTVVKIKGFAQNSIDFETMKKSFYEDESFFIIPHNMTVKKADFFLKEEIYEKRLIIDYYDKRKFSLDKKYTKPFTYENYQYF